MYIYIYTHIHKYITIWIKRFAHRCRPNLATNIIPAKIR